jgi:hypothetical protein
MMGVAYRGIDRIGNGINLVPGVLQLDVPYPERHSRLLIFIRGLLIIPHLFVLWLITIAALLISVVAWWAILVLGRYPTGMWDFVYKWSRWSANVFAYMLMMRDDYPPFGAHGYPVSFELTQMARQSRLLIFVRWLLLIPHLFILGLLYLAMYLGAIVAWWAILFTGHYPKGLFTFAEGVMRWSFRVHVYRMNLTDVYPPFSLE